MDIVIRQANIEDSQIIAKAIVMALGEEVAKEYCGEDYLSVLDEIIRMEDTQYSYRNALVAVADNVPVGASIGYDGGLLEQLREKTLSVIRRYNPDIVVTDDETTAGEFYLDTIGMLPEFRGLGIGRKLLCAMRDKAFSMGHKCVGLLVDLGNPGAERLYRSLGFEQVGVTDFFGHKMKHLQSLAGNS